ncbi:hypothetical protein [Mycolicibacterium llatzerense]|nr:hypothetical protein [Mycolicibacterium llatzerense]
MLTGNDLIWAFGCYVGMWGVGYLVVEMAKARQCRNQKQTTGEN